MAFSLRIFESESKEIKDLVLKYPNIETGGDLFGLWSRDGDAVVQLIIGPGEGCRRTSVSFHQDTGYLQRVGTYLNTSFMLCHLGSWHSHHQLNLTQPSAGDRSTVCNNFPPGLQRYIMIIANIVRQHASSDAKTVVLHPYMFTSKGHACDRGRVDIIHSENPYRHDGYVLNTISRGAEHRVKQNNEVNYSANTRTLSPQRAPRSPTRKNYISSARPASATSRQRNGYYDNRVENQWYNSDKGASKLKEMARQLKEKLTTHLEFSRDSDTLDLSLEFRHNDRVWSVKFPKSFDESPARILSPFGRSLDSKNIIEDIQKTCACSRCKFSVKDRVSRSPSPYNFARGRLSPDPYAGRRSVVRQASPKQRPRTSAKIPWYDTTEGKKTLDETRATIDAYLSKSEGKVLKKETSSCLQFVFRHGRHPEWTVEFPKNFPETQVKMYRKQSGTRKMLVCTLPEPLDVLGSLKRYCSCERCVKKRPSTRGRNPSTPSSRGRNPSSYGYSRHHAQESEHPPERRVTSPVNRIGHGFRPPQSPSRGSMKQWYSSESGEKKLFKIWTDLNALMSAGKQVEMTRSSSQDIRLLFGHNRREWRIDFPRDFPMRPPEIGFYDRTQSYYPVRVLAKDDIVRTIRNNCPCSSCRRYRSARIY